MSSAIPVVEVECPICGATGGRQVVVTRDFVFGVPGDYRFEQCRHCEHVFMNPRPADEAIMACYPSDYAPYLPADSAGVDAAAMPPAPGVRRWPQRLLRQIPGLRRFLYWLGQSQATIIPVPPRAADSRLLEIGCAHGGYLQTARGRGWTVRGVEPSEEAARTARLRGLEVQVGKIEEVEIPDASQDAVISWMVLEHVPNPLQFIDNSFRMLRPGGILALSVPNSASLERLVTGRYWQGYDAPRHLQIFSATEIRRLLANAGFVDIRIIHQAEVRGFYASIGGFGAERFPHAKWPERWLEYFRGEPSRLVHWLSLVPGKLLALLRCSGRITVTARKPPAPG